MKNILFLIPFVSYLISDIFHVPSEYPTIQEGIDSSADGDTVLVSQGIYYENILIDKSITLTSYAIFDNLDNWAEYDDQIFYEWQVSNTNIQNTIIDGGQPLNPDYGSTILISSDNQNICITPQIIGFTIQHGTGTLVNRHLDEDTDGDGENDDALDSYEESIDIFSELNNKLRVAEILIDMGQVHLKKNKLKRAEKCYERAKKCP